MSRVRGVTAATIRSGSGSATTTRAPDACSGPSSPKCSSVVVTTSSLGAELETGEDDVAAVRRRRRQRDVLGADADERGDVRPQLLAHLEEAREPREAAATLADAGLLLRAHRVDRPARERADAPGLEVGVALEHGELRACLLEGHAPDSDD